MSKASRRAFRSRLQESWSIEERVHQTDEQALKDRLEVEAEAKANKKLWHPKPPVEDQGPPELD